jgi:hypothetical protein
VTQNVIFSFPTIKQLAAHLSVLVVQGNAVDVVDAASAKDAIIKMIERYSAGLGNVVAVPNDRSAASTVVLLTGSTGGLGSHLLELLLRDDGVQKVYAFNRPPKTSATIFERHQNTFADRGLDTALLRSEKLVFVESDTALPKLGLKDSLFEEVTYLFRIQS